MRRLSRRGVKWLKRIGLVALAVVLLCAAPVLWTETQCMAGRPNDAPGYRSILPPEHRRNLVDSYLTYPEWSIVHAYEDFAGVTRARGESSFRYLESITGYWRSLCRLSAVASSRGPVTADVKAMLYVIGISFSGEMAVKGLYEKTIGALTEWIRGPQRTPEDLFALAVAEDYATFLRQTPWYEFPFGQTLRRFWRDTTWSTASLTRSVERRMALSAEYGVKAGYARLIAQGAALSPAKLTMRSVVDAGEPIAGVTLVAPRPDGSVVIETPRYRAFTGILLTLIGQGRRIIEIAGNDEIFVTVLADSAFSPGQTPLLRVPLQARPGWARYGFSVRLEDLAGFVQALRQSGGEFEHAYDY